MGQLHVMKIVPDSEAEVCFMNLLNEVGVNHDSVICRLGALFGKPYNEYVLSDGLFRKIKDRLSEKEEEV